MAMQFSKEDQKKLRENNSEIYKKRTEESNKEDIKNLSQKGKMQQFVDYYLKNIVIGVLVLCLLVGGIVQAVWNHKTTALYIAVQNDVFDENQIKDFKKTIEDYLKLSKDEEVIIDTAVSNQQLQTYLYAGTADILITDEKNFKDWGESEYFIASNKEKKKAAFYKEFDKKYQFTTQYITSKDITNNTTKDISETKPSDKTEYNCGIYLTDSKKYRQIGGELKNPVLGISTTSTHLEEAEKFTKYMMNNEIIMQLGKKNK